MAAFGRPASPPFPYTHWAWGKKKVVKKYLRCLNVLLCLTDVQMAAGQFMSAVRNAAAKIDGQSSHILVVNDVMPLRTLPV